MQLDNKNVQLFLTKVLYCSSLFIFNGSIIHKYTFFRMIDDLKRNKSSNIIIYSLK
jgi:hypothetical protein